ncbi:MAG: hypothetical protein ACPGC9_00140, partial [Cytophagales bacterium]
KAGYSEMVDFLCGWAWRNQQKYILVIAYWTRTAKVNWVLALDNEVIPFFTKFLWEIKNKDDKTPLKIAKALQQKVTNKEGLEKIGKIVQSLENPKKTGEKYLW